MKIEIEEREVDTLPNDMELGKYVRYKMNEAKKVSNINVAGTPPVWVTTATADVNIEWNPDTNVI